MGSLQQRSYTAVNGFFGNLVPRRPLFSLFGRGSRASGNDCCARAPAPASRAPGRGGSSRSGEERRPRAPRASRWPWTPWSPGPGRQSARPGQRPRRVDRSRGGSPGPATVAAGTPAGGRLEDDECLNTKKYSSAPMMASTTTTPTIRRKGVLSSFFMRSAAVFGWSDVPRRRGRPTCRTPRTGGWPPTVAARRARSPTAGPTACQEAERAAVQGHVERRHGRPVGQVRLRQDPQALDALPRQGPGRHLVRRRHRDPRWTDRTARRPGRWPGHSRPCPPASPRRTPASAVRSRSPHPLSSGRSPTRPPARNAIADHRRSLASTTGTAPDPGSSPGPGRRPRRPAG